MQINRLRSASQRRYVPVCVQSGFAKSLLALSVALIISPALSANALIEVSKQKPVAGNGGTPVSGTATAEPDYTMNPNKCERGKTYEVVIKSKKNDLAGAELVKNGDIDVKNKGVNATGSELSAEITIANTASFGSVSLKIIKKISGQEDQFLGSIEFSVIVAPPGPIPPGMEPQVDIMWTMVPQNIVKDNYGQRIGKNFYCIEVVIGNNSGYDLQVASVGFELGPVGKAATVVFEMLEAANQAAVEAAKAQSLALLQPNNEDNKVKAKTAEEVAARANAALKSAFEASLFYSKAVREAYEKAGMRVNNKIPGSSYRMTRGSLEHGEHLELRNLSVNFIKAFGPVLTGFLPFFKHTNPRANFSEGINIFSNPFEKGFEALFPDETINQLQRLDDQMLRDGMIIQNNTQLRTRVFFPKDRLVLEKKVRDNPLVVTMSLGTMYLIGDTIEYINRVRVAAGAPTGEVKPPPTINPGQPQIFKQNDGTKRLQFTGTNLEGAKLTANIPEVTVGEGSVGPGGTSVSVDLTIGEKAPVGEYRLTLSTSSGSISVPVPIIIKPAPPEATLSYGEDGKGSPPTQTPAGPQTVPIQITGKYAGSGHQYFRYQRKNDD